jgi:hypothetical protein
MFQRGWNHQPGYIYIYTYYDILWYIMIYYDMLWYIMIYYDLW